MNLKQKEPKTKTNLVVGTEIYSVEMERVLHKEGKPYYRFFVHIENEPIKLCLFVYEGMTVAQLFSELASLIERTIEINNWITRNKQLKQKQSQEIECKQTKHCVCGAKKIRKRRPRKATAEPIDL